MLALKEDSRQGKATQDSVDFVLHYVGYSGVICIMWATQGIMHKPLWTTQNSELCSIMHKPLRTKQAVKTVMTGHQRSHVSTVM